MGRMKHLAVQPTLPRKCNYSPQITSPMDAIEWNTAINIIDTAFAGLVGVHGIGTGAATRASLTDGKLYELRVLAWLLEQLQSVGYSARLVNGTTLVMRYSPGVVDRSIAYIELHDQSGTFVGEVWRNVEFLGLGFEHAQRTAPGKGPDYELEPDYHELDIAVVAGMPVDGHRLARNSIGIAVECKDRPLEKGFLREMLGLRRDLTVLKNTTTAPHFRFPVYPPIMSQEPPIRLFLCSSSPPRATYPAIWPEYAIHVLQVPI
jgi:hypothetical protein